VELYRYDGGAESAMPIALHRLTRRWTEGTGWNLWPGSGYVPDGATWILAGPGTPWTTPGGDYDTAVVGQTTLPAAMENGWVSIDATAAVRAWVEGGAPNHGLLLRAQSGDFTYHYYHSRDHAAPNLRPRLVIHYTTGGAATPTATPTATSTPSGAPSAWVYLPLILKRWSSPVTPPTATATPTATPTTGAPPGLIEPSDLVYQGAFAYPEGDAWAYSGHALAYYPGGDPTGPADGYPGSLYAAGSAGEGFDLVGEMTIPQPLISEGFGDLPAASLLQDLTDITGGWKDNCTYAAGCMYRELDGLEYLPNVEKIVWNLRDWYNTAAYDQDSLGWSNLDKTGAQGVWHIGDRPSEDNLFHNAKACNYLLRAPESFADQYLDGKWLIAGNHREAGALGGSQGPTLYALAPWEDGDPPAPGQNLDARALLYYRDIYECVWEGEGNINEHPAPGVCDFPGYRGMDNWGGGAWVQTADKTGILIVGRKGLGDNCYGSTELCGEDPCAPSSGYHAYPYQPQILFYDPQDLTEALAGSRDPWEGLPYAVHTVGEAFEPQCAVLGAAAHDAERGLIYVTERQAGPWGETAVHVWEIR
jgi:hypothetical protein